MNDDGLQFLTNANILTITWNISVMMNWVLKANKMKDPPTRSRGYFYVTVSGVLVYKTCRETCLNLPMELVTHSKNFTSSVSGLN